MSCKCALVTFAHIVHNNNFKTGCRSWGYVILSMLVYIIRSDVISICWLFVYFITNLLRINNV